MIDTNKYEGHIENIGRWRMFANTLPQWAEDADRKLVEDAPLLLEEVKRLRERIEQATKILRLPYEPENDPDYHLELAHQRSLQMSAAIDILEGNE